MARRLPCCVCCSVGRLSQIRAATENRRPPVSHSLTKALTRRDALAMLTLALTVAPLSARALVAPAAPASLALPVSDLLSFDPSLRKDPEGGSLFNLAFRVDAREVANTLEHL